MEFITGNQFKNNSNYFLDEFGYGMVKPIKFGETIKFFVKTDFIDLFFEKYRPKSKFILITHNSDYHINKNHIKYLDDKLLVKWYAQNVDLIHPKISSIPIGIANEKWVHGNTEILNKIILEDNEKTNLVYSNFSIHTNFIERTHCLNEITKLGIVMSENKDFETYLKELSKSYFVISPNGNGVDCHKTWESLYLKSIPIVTNSINVGYYKHLPILIINDWSDLKNIKLNEELYHKIWNDFKIKKINIKNFLK